MFSRGVKVLDNRYAKLAFVLAISIFALFILKTPKAYAAYDGSRLIDNGFFLDANSMNSSQIQQFLVDRGAGLASRSYVLTCGSPGDTATLQAYTAVSAPCGQTVPASTIIYYAARIYGLSPRVILATMQKEQSLTTAANPTDWQVNQAMGYGCPDSGGCGASDFFYQIDNGTWALRYHYERANGNNTWWNNGGNVCGGATIYRSTGLYAGATVTFKDEAGVGYRTYTLANAATASFYCYTPHAYNNHRNGAPNSDNPVGTLCYPFSPHVEFGSTGYCYTGSYNFVYWYEKWFGSSVNPPYTAQLLGVSVDKDFANLPVGEMATVTYTFNNAGSSTWYKNGPNPVRIGTTTPFDRQSAFCTNVWVSCARAAGMNETQVAPGQNATFTFTIQAPQTTGAYLEKFGLLAEGITWMSQNVDSLYINVIPATLSYNVHSAVYPSTIQSFATQNVTFQLRNTGNVTWYKNGKYPIKLATAGPQNRTSVLMDTTWESANRPTSLLEASVPPNSIGTFSFTYKGPAFNYGVLSEKFTLVADNFAWFGQTPLQIDTTTVAAYAATFNNVPNITIPKGEYYDLTITLQNTGTGAWSNVSSAQNAVKLVTDNPLLNRSGFCDTSWLSDCNKITYPDQATVAPNSPATFKVRLRAPQVAGFHPQAFSLYSETYGKFIGFVTVPITVTESTSSWVPLSINTYSDSSKTTRVQTDKLYRSRRIYVVITALNTGNTRWFAGGANPTRLATTNARDRNSAFCDSTWLSCNRVAHIGDTVVEPGGQTTISFWYQAPANDLASNEHFSLVTEGSQWLDSSYAVLPSVVSQQQYSWQKVHQYAFTDSTKTTPVDLQNLTPGQRVYIGIVARNTGNTPWQKFGANAVHIGTNSPRDRVSSFCDATWLSCSRPSGYTEGGPIDVGAVATFEFWYKAPTAKSTYNEAFNLVVEGQSWLNDTGTSFYTVVK